MIVRRPILYVVTWLTDFSSFIVVFAVGRELAELQSDPIFMGSVGAAQSLAYAVAGCVAGRLSDRIGPRRIMLTGLLLLAVSAVCLMLASRTGTLSAFVLSGLSVGMVYPPLMGLLNHGRDSLNDARGQGRVLVNFCLAWNLGVVAGQLTGGWLFDFGYQSPLLLAAGLATLAAMLVCLKIPSSANLPAIPWKPSPEHNHHQSLSTAFAHLAWVANLGGAFAFSTVIYLLPRLMVAMQISPGRHGVLLAQMRALVILVYIAMHRFRFWHHRFSTAVASQIGAIAGMLLIALAKSDRDIMIGLLLLGQLTGYNYFASLYYSTSAAAADARGAASGIHEATLALGFAAGAYCGGVAIELADERAPYVLSTLVIASSLIAQIGMFFVYVRPKVCELETSARQRTR